MLAVIIHVAYKVEFENQKQKQRRVNHGYCPQES
jgi:hypothetical protein